MGKDNALVLGRSVKRLLTSSDFSTSPFTLMVFLVRRWSSSATRLTELQDRKAPIVKRNSIIFENLDLK